MLSTLGHQAQWVFFNLVKTLIINILTVEEGSNEVIESLVLCFLFTLWICLSGCSQRTLPPMPYRMNYKSPLYLHIYLKPYEITGKDLGRTLKQHFLKCVSQNTSSLDALQIRIPWSRNLVKAFKNDFLSAWGAAEGYCDEWVIQGLNLHWSWRKVRSKKGQRWVM